VLLDGRKSHDAEQRRDGPKKRRAERFPAQPTRPKLSEYFIVVAALFSVSAMIVIVIWHP